LVNVNFFITKEDAALIFNFIDQDKDGRIDYIEFGSFWNEQFNIFDEGVPQDNEVHKLEYEILEHLAKIINNKEQSLWEFYHEIDRDNKGYMTEREFNFLLKKIGIEFDDVRCE